MKHGVGQGCRPYQLLWLIDEIDKYTIYKFFIMNLAHSPVLKALQDPVQVSMETLYGTLATWIAYSGIPNGGNGGPQLPFFQNDSQDLSKNARKCFSAFARF